MRAGSTADEEAMEGPLEVSSGLCYLARDHGAGAVLAVVWLVFGRYGTAAGAGRLTEKLESALSGGRGC